MLKKGLELTFNTVIAASIALLVFVVTVLIITGTLGDVVDGLKFWGNKTSKADCLVMMSSPDDKDNDNYLDNKQYTVEIKDSDGKIKEKKCPCDTDPNNSEINIDEKCEKENS